MVEMTRSESGGDGTVGKRRARFNRWRSGRPFAGGALLVLASLVIAWIPINIAPDTILIGETLSPIGLLFAALVFLCGIFALTRPGNADIFGVFGVVFSIFSLYGALGGLGIGLVLGIIGGVLCYAWRDEDEGEGGSGGTDDESEFDFADDSDDTDDSDGLFGTRSRVRHAVSADGAGAGGRVPSIALLVVTVVVLGAFAHPLVTAAAQPFPEQEGIDGTIVVAEEFSGSGFNHENVTTDTSNRESVSAGQFGFNSNVNIEGMTVYKNFRSGSGNPSHLTIKGSSASAPNGLSLTASEAYFGQLGIGSEPVVVPAARQKWSTCPGQDFLFSTGDLGPLPGPPIDASNVVTNTHQLSAPSITIENLELTMQEGTKSTSVSGTPECTRNPVEPVLDLFTANALALLTDEGVLSPNVTTNNGTVTNFSAPADVERNETYDVSATVTNAGYIEDEMTVAYRLDGETRAERNVTLGPDESTTVAFSDVGGDLDAGEYEHGVATENALVTDTITVTEANESANATDTATNASASQTNTSTDETTTNATATDTNETGATNTTAAPTDTTNETTSTSDETTVDTAATNTTPEETTTAPTQTPSNDTTSEATTTGESGTDDATATATTETATTTTQQTATANGSALVGDPVVTGGRLGQT
jgi:hypothetical protein